MKSVFRKIRSKKKEDQANQNASSPSFSHGPAPPISNSQPSTQPALQPVLQQKRTSTIGSEPAQAHQPQPPQPRTKKFHITTSIPPNELSRLLQLPASDFEDDPRDLVKIELPICPVCYNFDPFKAPRDGGAGRPSWAKAEFNISDDIPVSKIKIEKAEELRNTANGGCLYCSMVVASLGAVHPDWETENTFIHIYLASGLPVIVRLDFGATSVVYLGREAMLELGVDIAEGQQMEFTIRVTDSDKEAIEIEIFRSAIPNDILTAGDVALSPLTQHMGYAEEIPSDSGSLECAKFIKENIDICIKHHKCGTGGPLPLLPDRIIWIAANNATGIQLIEPQSIRAPYITLSYCWGPVDANTYLTNAENVSSKREGMNYNDLPPLFQDVVYTARRLGIEYIWIDRLCIIQGANGDFSTQAPKMGEIYGNATLTIATASATTEFDKILTQRERPSYNLNMDVAGLGSLKTRFRRLPYELGTEANGGKYGKMSSRAWIWQERLLAARTIFFTPHAIKFECRHHSIWEGYNKGLTSSSWSNQLDNITHGSWMSLVEEFMRRDITRSSDRLPAMESVMKRIAKSTGWVPLWGLWANALVESLCWDSKMSDKSGIHECKMNPAYYAPTWSWASVDGPISYICAKPDSPVNERDPRTWEVECRSLNEASGLIKLAGRVIFVELQVTIETHEIDPERPASEQQKFWYNYVVKAPGEPQGLPMRQDVALKPQAFAMNGGNFTCAVRVPFGEPLPEKSWKAHCACLLVGASRLRTTVLLLGMSSRVNGAWERVGLIDGFNPSIFGSAQIQLIDIV
ncbi:heterokaryon incompatibility protein-domain-containing protein [Dendryphion nanum]|uniref:Heterokaryon incompatibility protein-domain-containing protein n=1 Tax=Dendryphion nanum TaxID=256645 RepID=A0A9P9IPF3_9PLEO|nr:heterokaryon incompatibility protein-domain-containing protein [Dendryphion nanum]